ncbi:hypothetical protein RAD16_08545 [Bradyrhizobium sp. 18BD]
MARFLFWQGFLARSLGKVSWHAARQPVRARSCDMTVGYAFVTMDKTAPKIKYAPRQN